MKQDSLTQADSQSLPQGGTSADAQALSKDQAPNNHQLLDNWLDQFNDTKLRALVAQALAGNFDIRESAARVEAAKQQSIISGAPQLPTLNLTGSGQRQKLGTDNYPESYNARLELGWEIDLWGRLNDSATAGTLRYQSERATLASAKLSLVGNVAKAWYELTAQQELETLLHQRVTNLKENMEIIESGYRQGINSALDLYLARSDLASEKSQWRAQHNTRQQAQRTLEILLGQKPDAQLESDNTLERASQLQALPEHLPAEIVYQRPDLRAAYLQLQAADREVAAAHKARYPGLRITGSGGDSSDEFKNLFDQSSLTWSLLGSISQPLFQGGKLKAQEHQRRAELNQREQQFLQILHESYRDLLNSINSESAFQEQLQLLLDARDNAEAAYKLAFEKYQQGLQDYTTVLESQRRAFSSQSSVINARKNLLQNRINFYLATGASF